MSPFQRKFAVLSRDRNFLIRATVIIIAVCGVVGIGVGKLAKDELSKEEEREQIVQTIIAYQSDRDRQEFSDFLLDRGEPTPEAIAQYVTFFEFFVHANLAPQAMRPKEEVEKEISPLDGSALIVNTSATKGFLSDEEAALFFDYCHALFADGEDKEKAIKSLREKAEDIQPPRFANEFLGHALSRVFETRAESLAYFEAEVEKYPRSDFSRYRLLDTNLDLGNHDAVKTLLSDSSYRQLVPPDYAMKIGIEAGVPGLVSEGVVQTLKRRFGTHFAPLALIAGLVWFVILAQIGGVKQLRSGRLLLYSLGVIAGFISIPIGHIFITIQEGVLGFQLNGEFLNDVIYCISGIGLREETVKILLFLPFVPFIAKQRTSLEILITAGCVGLGFAIVENMGYFYREGPGVAFPRMIGGFLHITWTSLLGLALCRFWHYPKKCWEELVGTFVAVVLLHGIYDAFLIVPSLSKELGFLSFIILVLTGRYYFRKLAEFRGPMRHTISPLGIFVIGSAITIGVAFIFAMRYYSFDNALDGVGKGALMSGVIAFVFINEFRNE